MSLNSLLNITMFPKEVIKDEKIYIGSSTDFIEIKRGVPRVMSYGYSDLTIPISQSFHDLKILQLGSLKYDQIDENALIQMIPSFINDSAHAVFLFQDDVLELNADHLILKRPSNAQEFFEKSLNMCDVQEVVKKFMYDVYKKPEYKELDELFKESKFDLFQEIENVFRESSQTNDLMLFIKKWNKIFKKLRDS